MLFRSVTVTDTINVDPNIFVYLQLPEDAVGNSLAKFQSVASPLDIERYPTGAPTEDSNGFFRLAQVDLIHGNRELLEETWKLIVSDRNELVRTLTAICKLNLTELSGFSSTDLDDTGSSIVTEAESTTTELVLSANPIMLGHDVTLTATVSALAGNPGGVIKFYDGLVRIGIATIVNGVAQFIYSGNSLVAGFHSLTAVYQGTPQYQPSASSPTVLMVSTQSASFAIEKFTGDGVRGGFEVAHPPQPNSVWVFLNGILQEVSVSYTISGQLISFTDIPGDGDKIEIRYAY